MAWGLRLPAPALALASVPPLALVSRAAPGWPSGQPSGQLQHRLALLLVRAGVVESDSSSQLALDSAETHREGALAPAACPAARQACSLQEAGAGGLTEQ